MYIKSISLKNFRCYEDIQVSFDREYTVLVGVNGVGKSTILDAVAVALGSYLAGFDGITSNRLWHTDAHRKMYEMGSRIEAEEQYPVLVDAVCDIDGDEVKWQRSLQGKGGRTLVGEAKPIMQYAGGLQEQVRAGDGDMILPLVAHYGTGRSYMQKKQKHGAPRNISFTRTAGYAECMEPTCNMNQMMSWFEQMTLIQLQEQRVIPELEVVKRAMGRCYAWANNLEDEAEFEYKVNSHQIEIIYERGDGYERLPMKMLSDGLRNTINMVADIAYRMAVLNPQLFDYILDETPGVVLIDEVDMHLHPAWQRRIVEDLHNIFPKVQFIMTTHSPSVLANVPGSHVLLLENGRIFAPRHATYGRDVSTILREMMKVEVRPREVVELLDEFYGNLTEEGYPQAKAALQKLEGILGSGDSDVVEAKVMCILYEKDESAKETTDS